MAPTDFRRRRRRRRRRFTRLGAVVAVALVVVVGIVVLVGSISRVHHESGPYWRDVDQSYAVQIRGVVRQSNHTGAQLRRVLAHMATDTRASLETSLGTLATTTKELAHEASTFATPAPAAGAGADIAQAMADRAEVVAGLRSTVNGLLDMAPLPQPGTAGTMARTSATHTLSAQAAVSKLEAASAKLKDADRLYGAGRHALVRSPGHAHLPPSVWLQHTAGWTSGRAQSIVQELAGSSSLAPVHDVVLAPHALVLTPAPVPPVQGSSATATLRLPPTSRLSLTAVVADKGNVAEPGVVVEAQLQPTHGKAAIKRSGHLAVRAHGAVSVSLPSFRVLPAAHYVLTVRLASLSADPAGTGNTETLSISIAPPAPATVLQVTPAKGRPRGGTPVTILGTGFTSVRAVDFGKASARFTVVSKSQISAIAPPGTGTVTVTVVNRGGTSLGSSASHFTYKRPKH